MGNPHPEPAQLVAEAQVLWAQRGARLQSVPDRLVETRLALHSLAENIVSPARQRATGNEIALRWYPFGFGTPPFPDDRGDRVIQTEGRELVDTCDGVERRDGLTTLRAAGEFVKDLVERDGLSDEPLAIDPGAADFIAAWFNFATLVIGGLRLRAGPELEPGWVQLWPEHFDVATELGSEAAGQRASFGGSPGDDDHPEPYLYVAPWTARSKGELWNATAFGGAELSYADLRGSDDPADAATEFFLTRLAALTA